jgi:hypothetical protein
MNSNGTSKIRAGDSSPASPERPLPHFFLTIRMVDKISKIVYNYIK